MTQYLIEEALATRLELEEQRELAEAPESYAQQAAIGESLRRRQRILEAVS